jgi:hypothetical protein
MHGSLHAKNAKGAKEDTIPKLDAPKLHVERSEVRPTESGSRCVGVVEGQKPECPQTDPDAFSPSRKKKKGPGDTAPGPHVVAYRRMTNF